MDQVKAYLLGRAKRPEYWIFVIVLTIGCMIANLLLRNPTLVSGLSFIPWAVIASRRLRDFGWSPWWCVSTLAGGFVIGFVAGLINAITQASSGVTVFTPPLMMLLYAIVNWSVIIFIGSRKSRPAEAGAALVNTFS
ncbi:MAG: DUF805 domain-containing protein [Caulobacter sp.]|nr:DUF805 domain-containing protein [Caulobacter sp.]